MSPFQPSKLVATIFPLVCIQLLTTVSSYFVGPHSCADRYVHNREKYLTEFSLDKSETTNFLEFGDDCNSKAQSAFETILLRKYKEMLNDPTLNNNENLLKDLDKVWTHYRKATIDGTLGDRICNPRRLLACHPTLKRCVCRGDFQLDEQFNKPSYRAIAVHREIVESLDIAKDQYYNVTKCRALDNSNCHWEAIWLGFCNIECGKDHNCVGTNDRNSPKLCIRCDPQTDSAECETNMLAVLAGKDLHDHDYTDIGGSSKISNHLVTTTMLLTLNSYYTILVQFKF